MASAIFGPLYKPQPVTFHLGTPPDIAVERLSSATKSLWYGFLFEEALIGSVTTSRVVLRHRRPFFHNSFAPIFVGALRSEPGGAVLEGLFTVSLFTEVFMRLWLSGVALVFLRTLLNLIVGQPPLAGRIAAVLNVALMFLAGLTLASLGWWLSRGDIEYISQRVHESIEEGI
jgi:hypothetical protein